MRLHRHSALVLHLVLGLNPLSAAGQVADIVALTAGEAASRGPSWSPDGVRIAFESLQNGKWSLNSVDVATGRVELLIRSDANDRYPSWSPDGRQIVFVSDRTGEPDLHLLDVRTLEVTRLLHSPGAELFPAWSPDRRTIAFTRQSGDSLTIHTVTSIQSGAGEVTKFLGDGAWPRWSPDGTLLAFFSRRDSGGRDDEVYLLEQPAGESRRVTDRTGHDFCPSWNPEGDRLVVVSIMEDDSRALRIVNLEGEEQARLAGGFHRVTEPSWSPDGRFIAFAGVRHPGEVYQLFLAPAPP